MANMSINYEVPEVGQLWVHRLTGRLYKITAVNVSSQDEARIWANTVGGPPGHSYSLGSSTRGKSSTPAELLTRFHRYFKAAYPREAKAIRPGDYVQVNRNGRVYRVVYTGPTAQEGVVHIKGRSIFTNRGWGYQGPAKTFWNKHTRLRGEEKKLWEDAERAWGSAEKPSFPGHLYSITPPEVSLPRPLKFNALDAAEVSRDTQKRVDHALMYDMGIDPARYVSKGATNWSLLFRYDPALDGNCANVLRPAARERLSKGWEHLPCVTAPAIRVGDIRVWHGKRAAIRVGDIWEWHGKRAVIRDFGPTWVSLLYEDGSVNSRLFKSWFLDYYKPDTEAVVAPAPVAQAEGVGSKVAAAQPVVEVGQKWVGNASSTIYTVLRVDAEYVHFLHHGKKGKCRLPLFVKNRALISEPLFWLGIEGTTSDA